MTSKPKTPVADVKHVQPGTTAEWWQWVLSYPLDDNPMFDNTGALADHGDMGNNFFLAGTSGGSAERSFEVGSDQTLIIPMVNAVNVNIPDIQPEVNPPSWLPQTPGVLRNQLRDAPVKDPYLTIEKVDRDTDTVLAMQTLSPNELKSLFTQSGPFSVTMPDNNFFDPIAVSIDPSFDVKAGTYGPSVSTGYWAAVGPLAAGEYDILFGGKFADGTPVTVVDHITVV